MGLNELARRMPDLPRKVLVGVSGGADSVALMHLARLKGVQVSAVHVNHALRGEAADADERFVRAMCLDCGVPLQVFRLSPPPSPGEDWARRERYRCFREALSVSGAEGLATAHHQDDQAETLLLHLMRGAGLTGLTCMAEETEAEGMRILRPLLRFTRQELRDALEADGISWREDQSNQDAKYLRNAVRLELLPLMERLSPGCSRRLAGTAALLRGEDEVFEGQAEDFLACHARGNCLLLAPLLMQRGMQGRILRRWWQKCAGSAMDERSLSQAQTASLLSLVQGRAGQTCNLPGGWRGYRGWTHLHLLSPEDTEETGVMLLSELPEGCTVRTRRTGDWLRLPGGRRSLQDFFTDRKVDAPFRDKIPLMARDSEILAAAGVWQQDDDIRWAGDMPWAQHSRNSKGD